MSSNTNNYYSDRGLLLINTLLILDGQTINKYISNEYIYNDGTYFDMNEFIKNLETLVSFQFSMKIYIDRTYNGKPTPYHNYLSSLGFILVIHKLKISKGFILDENKKNHYDLSSYDNKTKLSVDAYGAAEFIVNKNNMDYEISCVIMNYILSKKTTKQNKIVVLSDCNLIVLKRIVTNLTQQPLIWISNKYKTEDINSPNYSWYELFSKSLINNPKVNLYDDKDYFWEKLCSSFANDKNKFYFGRIQCCHSSYVLVHLTEFNITGLLSKGLLKNNSITENQEIQVSIKNINFEKRKITLSEYSPMELSEKLNRYMLGKLTFYGQVNQIKMSGIMLIIEDFGGIGFMHFNNYKHDKKSVRINMIVPVIILSIFDNKIYLGSP
jgi:hypothetical protein